MKITLTVFTLITALVVMAFGFQLREWWVALKEPVETKQYVDEVQTNSFTFSEGSLSDVSDKIKYTTFSLPPPGELDKEWSDKEGYSYICFRQGDEDKVCFSQKEFDSVLDKQRNKELSVASWYDYHLPEAPDYSKHYDTCASRDYAKGTMLKVTYKDKSVVCRVNDYGPEAWTDRQIDLSSHAFAQLSSLSRGLLNVSIQEVS